MEMVRVTTRISKKLKRAIEQRSVDTGINQSAIISLAVEEYILRQQAITSMASNDFYRQEQFR